MAKRGGFAEVVSRDQTGDMKFEVKFRPSPDEPIITYELTIGLNEKQIPVVKKEVMRFRRGQHGAPWKILDFFLWKRGCCCRRSSDLENNTSVSFNHFVSGVRRLVQQYPG